MDASQYEARKAAVLAECEVVPAIFEDIVPRLEQFMKPFVASLARPEQVKHTMTFVGGLLSDLSHKNTESIAYLFGQERLPLQHFLGVSPWDDGALRHELARQIGQELGDPNGVLVLDPSTFPFRQRLREMSEQYLLAVPSNTLIRDFEVEPPEWIGRGRPPKHPMRPWQHVSEWAEMQPAAAWTKIDVRDGSKGPLVVQVLKRRVRPRHGQQESPDDELLVVIRYRDRDDRTVTKTDYYLSNADPETALAELARVAKAEHRIEECFQRAKSEAGLADYECRTWVGWHHHQT